MKSHPGATTAAPYGHLRFDERLTVPLWWWLPALVTIGLIYLDVHLGHPGWPAWLVVVLLIVLAGLAIYRTGRGRVSVTEDENGQRHLRVGPATLPIHLISDIEVCPARDKQETLGPLLDPVAYVRHKPWIGPMVRVVLDDPSDPTPYWLFSTRRPDALVECLRTPRRADRGLDPQ